MCKKICKGCNKEFETGVFENNKYCKSCYIQIKNGNGNCETTPHTSKIVISGDQKLRTWSYLYSVHFKGNKKEVTVINETNKAYKEGVKEVENGTQ